MHVRLVLSGVFGLLTLFQVSSAHATCARFCEDELVAADCRPLGASPTIAANEPLRLAGTCEVQCAAGGTGTRTPAPFAETYRAWQGEVFDETKQEVSVTTADGPRCGERAVRVVTPTAGVWSAGKHGASAQGGRAHAFSVSAADDAGEGGAGCSASGHGESRGLFGLVAALAVGTLVVARRRRSRRAQGSIFRASDRGRRARQPSLKPSGRGRARSRAIFRTRDRSGDDRSGVLDPAAPSETPGSRTREARRAEGATTRNYAAVGCQW